MLFGTLAGFDEDFWNIDPGTAEIWLGTDLVALVAVSEDSGHYDERWALFHGGARRPDGKMLGTFPAKDLPPEYGVSPHTGPLMLRIPAAGAAWADLHDSNGDLEEFGEAALAAVASVYSVPVGTGLAANTDWVSGAWAPMVLTQAVITSLVAGEHKVSGSAIRRWFEARRGGQMIGRVYAEHRNGSNTRVVHQTCLDGLHPGGGDATLIFEGQGGSFTLANFLNYAKAKQNQNQDPWLYTLGTATWYDSHV